MELKWLEDFLALAELGGFSKAAEARNVTQPAFGRRIRALERWLGTDLIDRSAHPPELTPAGRQFRESAADLVRDIHSLRRDLRQTGGDTAGLVIAAPHVLALSVVPRWLSAMKADQGPFAARLVNESVHDCIQAMLAGGVDFLITFYHPQIPLVLDPRRFPHLSLGTERLRPYAEREASGQARHRLPGSSAAPLPYLTYGSGTFLERAIALHLAQMPQTAHLIPSVENTIADSLKAMASDGQGLAWLPESAVTPDDLAQRLAPAGDESWTLSLGIRLYWASERPNRLARAIWQEMSKP
ncbi:MAG: LysR substrate-binding domain-containing protein [Kiloniellales bacterium]